ncbi:MAG: hypothetical protein ACYDER_28470 [Ktedonobacteraceae bacterium]
MDRERREKTTGEGKNGAGASQIKQTRRPYQYHRMYQPPRSYQPYRPPSSRPTSPNRPLPSSSGQAQSPRLHRSHLPVPMPEAATIAVTKQGQIILGHGA